MKVLILAAGYGTRLYPIIKDTAKALLQVLNKPLIDHSLNKIKGIKDLSEVIVVTNEKFFESFNQWSKTHKEFKYPIRVINDRTKTPEERLGSVGDIEFVLKEKPLLEDLLVLGGDNLFNFGIEDFLIQSKKNIPKTTIGLYDIKDLSTAKNFGVVALDKNNKIISFEEKPEHPQSTLIAMCLYYFPQSSLSLIGRYLKEGQKSDASGGYIKWLYQIQDVYGFKFQGKWYDIGSIESYNDAQKNFNN